MTERDSSTSPEPAHDKKERVLHTRVPAVLEQELKRLADNIRVPVSNLVRAILEDAVSVADRAGRGVEEELHKAAANLTEKREAILAKKDRVVARTALGSVLGFQPLVLAGEAVCAKCWSSLRPGDDAHVGVSADASAPRVVVCEACVPKRRKPSSEPSAGEPHGAAPAPSPHAAHSSHPAPSSPSGPHRKETRS